MWAGWKKRKTGPDHGVRAENSKISLCMIVKDEAEFLEQCIESVRHVVDEVIIVDTGSRDDTPELAKRLGAKVFRYRWSDDFSEARNYSLSKAAGGWILVLDADEVIARRDAEKIRLLAKGEADGYLFTYRSYSQNSHDIRWVANDDSYEEGEGWDGWVPGRVVRMFKRAKGARFEGAVHETVERSIAVRGGEIASTDIIIHHFHERKGKEKLREKQLEYLRLCEKNLSLFPECAKTHFDIGLVHRYILNDIPRGVFHQKEALRLDPLFEDARIELALLYNLMGDFRNAASEAAILLQRNPKLAPAWLLCAIMLERRGKDERAIECYERALSFNPDLVDARVNMGTLLLKRGDTVRALCEWEKALHLNPTNTRALLNMGALELRNGNYALAERFLNRAVAYSADSAPLWNNMGVLYMHAGRMAEAVEAFEKAQHLNPSCEDFRRNLNAARGQVAPTC
ncbi:MAG: tetratricopeptide repeat protein [Candidatus Abyssobacteria bacterium SURF_17]|jgi:Tfp pilus assembly protein PilF|uniref:Tetratricopeptide repeat protein n=1 Tax=Candidatus Abyssobacteria bacterium SURF_17 TaxID=2093361 RepID=A0A419F2F0_9BACT|nr:MAG: tetratricopeptide repeat protein [Candidatus Abyssubacteria bacterium SURF_17]